MKRFIVPVRDLRHDVVQAAIAWEQNPSEVQTEILVKAVQEYKKERATSRARKLSFLTETLRKVPTP